MASGLFTLRNQLQALVQKAWTPTAPISAYQGIFSGVSATQYLTIPSTTFPSDFCVESWVLLGNQNIGTVFCIGDCGGSNNGIEVQFVGYGSQIIVYTNGTTIISYSNYPQSVGYYTHVALTRSGSSLRLFVNGTQIGSAVSNSTTFTGATKLGAEFYNGSYGTNQYLLGNISNFRMVKGNAVYTSNFTPPTSPLTAITGTYVLTLQNSTIIDNSGSSLTISNNNSVTTSIGYPFNTINTSTPAVEYLVVAGGGGGGGANWGGGGGAGGLLQGIIPVIAGVSNTITVGGGGAGGTNAGSNNDCTNGSNSVFGNVVSIGGGHGGGQSNNAVSGGSGGGGSAYANVAYFGQGQGTFGQGNAGGYGGGSNSGSGGGGGAGTVGISASSGSGGNGGTGVSSAISGTITAYAGGGGGCINSGYIAGVGGVGGGGNGSIYPSSASSATTNTGGGGGGAPYSANGGAGGSGIVVISYPDTYNAPSVLTGSYSASTSGSGSLNFSGSTTYVTGPTTSALNFGTGSFTVEFWVYATSIGTLTEFFSCTNATQDFQIALSPTNYLYWHNSGVQISNVSTPASCPLNQWNHIVFVRSGVNCALFCNGVRYGTTTNSASINLTNYYIGAYWNAVNAYNLNGYISNLRISNTAVYNPTSSTLTTPTTPFTAASSTVLLMNTVSGSQFTDSSTSSLTNSATGPVNWSQLSPFATGLGYKNRVYTWTGSGTITF